MKRRGLWNYWVKLCCILLWDVGAGGIATVKEDSALAIFP